jgi:hypothetical protein
MSFSPRNPFLIPPHSILCHFGRIEEFCLGFEIPDFVRPKQNRPVTLSGLSNFT